MNDKENNEIIDLEQFVSDGIYVVPEGPILKDLHGAINEVDRLGRPLTDEELKAFL